MVEDAALRHEPPHPVGLFGRISGREVELLSSGPAGALGIRVAFVSARRSDVPEGTPEVTGSAGARDDVICVPRSAVEDLVRWTWTAVLDGAEYGVQAVRDGRAAIVTRDSRLVWGDGWEGDARDGWARWVDVDDVEVTAHRHPIPPWKAMTPSEACDVMGFWADASWPLTRDEVIAVGAERFGWSVEVDRGVSYLMNTVSGFTIPDVSTIGENPLSYLTLRISDVIREVTPASTSFLGDAFTLAVREGERRWGPAALREVKESRIASWDAASGGRISFSSAPKSLAARFETPQGVALEKRLGH
ncbi:DUF6301 family protein [Agromyces soli]|uniref:DUF6301 family protein n=1 Tax=Agromyces soli TaxID=659012 RepID=A0ABY4AZK3_9MICO|nr:DUF6301 family protein [Agromyces soli]UOE27847.1 DUF6301 family protein [Agromyces soli]